MNSLTGVLHSLVELHENLLTTARKKQQILIRAEMNPLLAILSEESKLIKKINEADQKRMASLGEEAYQSSLSALIEKQTDGAEREEWIHLHQQLQQLFQEIERVNQSNQQLLKQSLSFTKFMIEQMLPQSEGSGVYNPMAASKEMRDSVRLFDAKA
jgi:FlgN protein